MRIQFLHSCTRMTLITFFNLYRLLTIMAIELLLRYFGSSPIKLDTKTESQSLMLFKMVHDLTIDGAYFFRLTLKSLSYV